MALAESLDLTPTIAPTPVGCSGASVADLPVPLLTTFSTKSDLVKLKPVITPMLFALNHRNFRCLRVGGPAGPVSLNLSAGPARQLLQPLLLPREPPRRHCSLLVQPLRLSCAARAVAVRAQLHLSLHHRSRAATPHRACASPCTADRAPPASKTSTAACSTSTPSPHAVHLHPPLGSPHAQGTELTVPLPPCALLHLSLIHI